MTLPLLLVAALLPANVGRVSFPISCTAPAQKAFTRGVSALHSFWYAEARTQFQAAEKADPKCALAFWGEAMSYIELLWLDDDVPAARAVLAKLPGEPPTARERAWLQASRPLFSDDEIWPRRSAFADGLEALVRAFPEDDEAKAFLSLALLTRTSDMPLPLRARSGALALEVSARNPDHPGAVHYAIHAFDTPELAPLALPAARRYAQIAPEAFHARHMPAHTFSRLAMWPEAVASCQSAWEVSEAWVRKAHLSPGQRDFHSLQWIVAIEDERGRIRAAEAALARFAEAARSGGASLRGWYASVAVRHARSVDQWARLDEWLGPMAAPAEAAPPPPAPPATSAPAPAAACHAPPPPYADFHALHLLQARVEAAARRHDPGGVERGLTAFAERRQRVAAFDEKFYGKEIYQRVLKQEALEAAAWRAFARSDWTAAVARWRELAVLRELASLPDGADDGGGTHYLIGDALVRAGKPKEAVAEFERAVAQYPGHVLTLLALGRTTAALGDSATARRWYARAVELWSAADDAYAPATEARAWLAAHPGR